MHPFVLIFNITYITQVVVNKNGKSRSHDYHRSLKEMNLKEVKRILKEVKFSNYLLTIVFSKFRISCTEEYISTYMLHSINATLFHIEYCEERVNTAGLFYSLHANLWGIPGAMEMTPGQTLRTKLLECSQSLGKDVKSNGSGCIRLSALFKVIIEIYDVHLEYGQVLNFSYRASHRKSCPCDPHRGKTWTFVPDLPGIHLYVSFSCCSCTVSFAVINLSHKDIILY